MGKLYTGIDDELSRFITQQRVFFVATAPAGDGGHVNLSPKGLDAFRVLGPKSAGYIDFTGSGIETVAHVRDNGRIVFMFCAFEGPPRIVRLHGRARVVQPNDAGFETLLARFAAPQLTPRAIIVAEVTRIASSCGYGVPLYTYQGERDQAVKWEQNKGPQGLDAYRKLKNSASIDGLPGLHWPADA